MSGIVIWAERFEEMKRFYVELLRAQIELDESEYVRISNGMSTIHLHQVPSEYLGDLSTVAGVRSEAPIKPIFDVSHLENISVLDRIPIVKIFTIENVLHHDVIDPDGNVICLRQPVSG